MKPIDESCEEFYEQSWLTAANWYKDHPMDDHPPMIILLRSDESIDILMVGALMDGPDGGARASTLQQASVGMRIGDLFVRAALLITEGWGRLGVTDEEMKDPKRPRNADHPDRIEYLIFSLLTEHKQAMMMCKIDRKRKSLERQPLVWLNRLPEGHSVDGRMVR